MISMSVFLESMEPDPTALGGSCGERFTEWSDEDIDELSCVCDIELRRMPVNM